MSLVPISVMPCKRRQYSASALLQRFTTLTSVKVTILYFSKQGSKSDEWSSRGCSPQAVFISQQLAKKNERKKSKNERGTLLSQFLEYMRISQVCGFHFKF